jgi:hypothetical protein
MAWGGRHRWRALGTAAWLVPAAVSAQQTEAPGKDDIVITGKRLPGSVIGDTEPVAVLDAAAMQALGVTSLSDMLRLLKPLTTSASGADPVFLLDGRRISGYSEIQSLPPEAMLRSEILPETEAARFGFPSTVRVVNFITKPHFRAVSVEEGAGSTTDGGGGIALLQLGSTRIDGGRRQSLAINYDRQDPLLASRRSTFADTSSLFDGVGNIGGVGGGSIDPALDALAGRPVTSAAVPVDPALRGTIAGYVTGANQPRVFNLSPYQSLSSRDTLKVDGTQAIPLGASVMASLNLTMEAKRGSGLAGLPRAVLRVPAGNPALPFTRDVLLYRYVTEAAPLEQRTSGLDLHAGSTLQGSVKRWQWTLTGSYDQSRASAAVDQGIVLDGRQAAITAGGDPFAPFTSAEVANRIVTRSRTNTGTVIAKATANGPVLALPAGDAQMTLTSDYARSTSSGSVTGTAVPASDVRRVTRAASVNIDLPIASASRGVLDAIGSLTANGTIGVSSVSDYGSLVNSQAGLTWTPVSPVQVTASVNTTQTPPAIGLLTTPVVTVPNVPYFDFVTGGSALVTVVTGGNAALAPERRRISTVGASWKPMKAKELRLNLDYIETRIAGQTSYLSSVTPALQAAFPGRFVRDAGGQLLSVDLRPVNLTREVERKIQGKISLWTQIGPEPKPPAGPPASGAPPPPPPKPRPMIYSFVTITARLDDRLVLRPGQPQLDLLGGDTLGTGGRPRYEAQGTLGGSWGPVQGGFFAMWQGPTRVRSDIPTSDLRFSAKTFVALYSTIDAAKLAPRAIWARRMTFQLNIQNILNDRIAVRDRNGAVPYRFQPAFLDPYGRIVRLSVRKLF